MYLYSISLRIRLSRAQHEAEASDWESLESVALRYVHKPHLLAKNLIWIFNEATGRRQWKYFWTGKYFPLLNGKCFSLQQSFPQTFSCNYESAWSLRASCWSPTRKKKQLCCQFCFIFPVFFRCRLRTTSWGCKLRYLTFFAFKLFTPKNDGKMLGENGRKFNKRVDA